MSGWTTNGLTPAATGAIPGLAQFSADTQATGGQSPETIAITVNNLGLGVATVAAAGASQGTATAFPASLPGLLLVTVTASTEGVKLPAVVTTGMRVTIMPSTAVGVKVYPGAAGQSIGTATTATTAVAVALNKSTQFIATSATKWRVLASA